MANEQETDAVKVSWKALLQQRFDNREEARLSVQNYGSQCNKKLKMESGMSNGKRMVFMCSCSLEKGTGKWKAKQFVRPLDDDGNEKSLTKEQNSVFCQNFANEQNLCPVKIVVTVHKDKFWHIVKDTIHEHSFTCTSTARPSRKEAARCTNVNESIRNFNPKGKQVQASLHDISTNLPINAMPLHSCY